ncbi:MAG: methylated-DNA--[protein]-cysteine S-methyltransferase [Sedimentibacter sp.]|uniref:methylated-DNA--[protein]-cysteine S-methyltransferase n=1 Tax=Sedimentibacter sp. TaxID=1960295 RepID=UPI002981B908|nr:methylated-DNA--[protein]-cysteine S-methyltransferase [Sedimentibacter sp.]MDW5299181.1 methylated-DNA--[protein]-cysteine S-methyltransferase [Sedimentibacter sp.]
MKNVFVYNTIIGQVAVIDNGIEITNMDFADNFNIANMNVCETKLINNAANQLNEYLNGTRTAFDLPLNPEGTEFQKKVWTALCKIPYAETRSYKQIAEAVGNPKAFRAVGMANNKNPIIIFIPCHRVIGSNGSLVGYAGGLDMKEKLLALEKEKGITAS